MGAGKSLKTGEKKFGRRKVENEKKLFFSFSTFLRPNFFSPVFRLFPAPTNCPWVSEDVLFPNIPFYSPLSPFVFLDSPVFSCFSLYSPVFACILLYSPVFSCILLCSLVFSSILLHSFVFSCILLYSPVFSSIPLYSPVFSCILLYSPVYIVIIGHLYVIGIKTSFTISMKINGHH